MIAVTNSPGIATSIEFVSLLLVNFDFDNSLGVRVRLECAK